MSSQVSERGQASTNWDRGNHVQPQHTSMKSAPSSRPMLHNDFMRLDETSWTNLLFYGTYIFPAFYLLLTADLIN